MFDKESIHAYIGEIARQFATGAATEHSFRRADAYDREDAGVRVRNPFK